MALPPSLSYKIEVFKSCGHVPLFSEESYQEPSWVSIFLGLQIYPRRYDPLVDNLDTERLKRGMQHRRTTLLRLAQGLPNHREHIARYCDVAQPAPSQSVAASPLPVAGAGRRTS
jgi:tryptophan halogenase